MNSVRCPVPGCRDQTGQAPRELAGAPVCDPCRGRAGRALADLPLAYVELRGTAAGTAGTEYVSGTTSPGEPINVEHRVHATHIHNRLTGWEDVARGLRRLTARRAHVREGWAVGRAVALLLAHGDAVLDHPAYGPDYAADLIGLRHRAHAMLGRGGGTSHHVAAPCPHCDRRSLVRFHGDAGSDYVRCINCRAYWDDTEYQRFVRVLADAARQAAAQ